jgi:hypothetical protein
MPPLFGYVGPGAAGFAFLGSFLTLISSFFLAAGSLLLWPFRAGRTAPQARLPPGKESSVSFLWVWTVSIRGSPSASRPRANCPNLSRLG